MKMKKISILLFSLAIMALFATSCKKDSSSSPSEPGFSNNTVEQNKQSMEQSGIDLVNNMDQLRTNTGIKTLAALADLTSQNTSIQKCGLQKSKIFEVIYVAKSISQGNRSVENISNQLKSTKAFSEDTTIAQVFESNKGTWNWDPQLGDFVKTPGGNSIIINFPAVKGSTVNNATITLYSYTGQHITSIIDDYNGDYPTGLSMDMKVDNQKVMAYNFAATYNSDGTPSSVTTSWELTPFIFSVSFINTQSKVSIDYSLKNAANVIVDLGWSASGNFTKSNIDNSTNPSTVVTSTTAFFQLMNVKITGTLNIKDLNSRLNTIQNDQSLDDSTRAYKEADAANADMSLYIMFVDKGTKIADVIAYPKKVTETYSSWDYNPYTQQWYEVQMKDTYYDTDFRFAFKDQTKVDAKTYFGAGFQTLLDDINKFIADVNSDFGANLNSVQQK
jgi:hypothetical protein